MADKPEILARRCFEAFFAADRAAMEALLHDDFTFTSPYDAHIDRAAYFNRCWPGAGSFTAFEIKSVIADGADGCIVLYEGASAKAKFRNIEHMRCHNGRIVSTEVFFGREQS
jgi:hypothetical protein